MLRALLFDKDGTLVDFQGTWAPAALHAITVLSAGRPAVFDALVELAGFDLAARRFHADSPMIAGSSADYGPHWAALAGEEPGTAFNTRLDGLMAAAALEGLAEVAGAAQALERLAGQGFRLGLLTNDSEAAAIQHCERLGFRPHVGAIIGYDSGHGRKPAPDPVLAYARQEGLAPHEIALIGDSLHDLDAARAAGAVAIAVLSGPASRAVLEPHADHVIDSIVDLPALLERLQDAA